MNEICGIVQLRLGDDFQVESVCQCDACDCDGGPGCGACDSCDGPMG